MPAALARTALAALLSNALFAQETHDPAPPVLAELPSIQAPLAKTLAELHSIATAKELAESAQTED